jgi:hypothetical protein
LHSDGSGPPPPSDCAGSPASCPTYQTHATSAHRRGVVDPLAGDDQLTADQQLTPGYNSAV